MNHLEKQLNQWSVSTSRVTVTPDIAERLGVFSDEARQAETEVDAYTFTYDVTGLKVAGFLVAPKKRDVPLPAIIYNRGGTSDFGLVPRGALLTRLARIAKWGYIVVGSQYPGNKLSEGHDERGGKTDIDSVLRLKDLIIELSDADEHRIGMYGMSRGGMMTYLCMKEVSWIRAALTVGGLVNLERTLQYRPKMAELYERHFGNTKEAKDARSAVKWANELHKGTPICLLHGGADTRVNPHDVLELAERLEDAHHPYALHIVQGGDHGLVTVYKERDSIVRKWFDQYLKESR